MLYIVRHGETLFNHKRIVQGRCDSPLTKEGREQAFAVGRGLAHIAFGHAYCSPLGRTVETMQCILHGRDIPVTYVKDLQEIAFGDIEGDPITPVFKDRLAKLEGFAVYGGETLPEAGDRIVKVWHEIAAKHLDEDALIVSHGGVIMAGLEKLSPGSTIALRAQGKAPANCSVTMLELEAEQLVVKTVGDISYREMGKEKQ